MKYDFLINVSQEIYDMMKIYKLMIQVVYNFLINASRENVV